MILIEWIFYLALLYWWHARDYSKWADRWKKIAKLLTPSISMLIVSFLTSLFAVIALIAQYLMVERFVSS